MLAMLGLLMLSSLGLAWDVSRAHLGRGSALSRALRVLGVELGLIVRRSGVGGKREGEMRAAMTLAISVMKGEKVGCRIPYSSIP